MTEQAETIAKLGEQLMRLKQVQAEIVLDPTMETHSPKRSRAGSLLELYDVTEDGADELEGAAEGGSPILVLEWMFSGGL